MIDPEFTDSRAMPEKTQTALFQDTEVFARISTLKLYARELVEGLLSGQHRSRHKGSSVEFSEYKDYSPGDDIRHIDWKVAGKTDKYHVKQFEQSTNLKCTIMLDGSGSMAYTSPHAGPDELSKANYASTLAAAFAYLMLRQFDAVGLIQFNEHVVSRIPPRSKPSHFQNLLWSLASYRPAGQTRLSQVISETIDNLPHRSLLVIISDLLAPHDEILKNLKLLTAHGIEVLLFHVLHPDEIRFPFEGNILFESLEDGTTLGVDAYDARQAYQDAIGDLILTFRGECPALGVDYQLFDTSAPLDQVLSYYLHWRKMVVRK